uniref:DUF4806 domain-containing protein n=1 Tax=Anopheles atroparvus TaxID=41427 RepID=A0AAG5CQI4_ANOAO
MEPASKILRLESAVTGETVRQIAQQSVPPTVTSSAPVNASMQPGKPQVPLKTSLTVITTSMPSLKPGRPPLPPKPTVTLSITSKSSSKPEKPPLPSMPTITLSTTLKPTTGFAASPKSLSQTLLPFTDASSSIQTAVLPNPRTTPFTSSSILPPPKAVPESSQRASVVQSSIQTAVLQVLGVVQQIHDTQKLQVEDSKRLEAKVDALASRMANLEEQVKRFAPQETSIDSERPTVVTVKMEKLSSIEDLHNFDNKLGSDKEFFKAIALWIEGTIIEEGMENRIRKALDLLFDRELLFRSSENQPRPNVFFAKCTNIHKLLQTVWRGNRSHSPTEQIVINQSIQKLCNESSSS